jgi:hypothetical protein
MRNYYCLIWEDRSQNMKKQDTLSDTIIHKIKNNPVIAVLIVAGMIIIALASFTNAVKSLLNFMPAGSAPVDVSGKWTTDILTNQFDKNDTFRITLEFEAKGQTLLGTLRKTSPSGSYDYAVGIVDGKIDGANISFFLPEQSMHGTEYVSYKNLYYGELADNRIDFTLQSDRPWGFKPIKFIATRQH